MNLSDLALIQDVARQGSFAAVARQRDSDPSSIGRIIAGIEEELGFRLFARTTRRMELTEAGTLYLGRIMPAYEELQQAADDCRAMQHQPSGTLRISASATFGQRYIVPRLAEFRRAYPAVSVEGIFSDSNVDLLSDHIDLAIRLAPAVEGDFVISKLMDTHYHVVAAPDYLRIAPPLERPEDLVRHRAILFPYADYRSRWIFRDAEGRVIEQKVAGDFVLSPAGALRDAAIAGLGPALLPDWLVREDVDSGALRLCLSAWQATATNFDTAAWMIYPSRKYLPAKVRAMIDFLRGTSALRLDHGAVT
ncbi:LysR family transcriptional regulator [Devosia sp.]|uniref:LysR family transcriptional regulator n=1 Tax=Devosia sp. TaxID=1871048 RepID=UPI0025FD7367|nr:LysR family transcriptional regulator [Devosia sp.]MCR6633478.1 LysR substrate-binding domain-containing protein [Devosia sp.]